jgi:GTP-binding protein HflX
MSAMANDQEFLFKQEEAPLAVLVSVLTAMGDPRWMAASLEELERLLETAGGKLFSTVVQQLPKPNPATYIGSGKVKELSDLCRKNQISLVIFDTELSPAQIRNIENEMDYDENSPIEVRVIDRTMLILDIFALHATTGEGKLQVELAQLRYTIPRLSGKGSQMSRLGGGIGTRGPGESKLETDRRHLQKRISALQDQLAELEKNRKTMRTKRDASEIPKVAIVGYTNAGKSTLLNYLTNAGILAEDKLFATLDPTTRSYRLPSGREVLLTDTVGFIRNLPHHLISAFRSTLEEVTYDDVLMIVMDASDPEAFEHLNVTEALLDDLGASKKPRIYVFNKIDAMTDDMPIRLLMLRMGTTGVSWPMLCVSAKDGTGMDILIEQLEKVALRGKKLITLKIPVSNQELIAKLYQIATVEDIVYGNEFVSAVVLIDDKGIGQLKKYMEL